MVTTHVAAANLVVNASEGTRLLTSRHPELSAEQQYLDNAHDCHETAIERYRAVVEGRANGGGDANAQRAIRDGAIENLKRLEDVDTSRLIFGRLDFTTGKKRTLYVGPCLIKSLEEKVQVIDFSNELARPFYYADEADPLGLGRRRTFDLLERESRDISDE